MVTVSLITATYNCKDVVGDCLDSVASQVCGQVQHVVVDGASTDGTAALLEARLNQIDNYSSEPDSGIYDALNKGISRATGDIIGFLHADDLFVDRHVLQSVAEVFSDKNVAAVYGDLVYVARRNPNHIVRFWRAGEYDPTALERGWMPPHPTLYLRRSIYADLGGFDTSYKIAADYDFILRVLPRLGRILYLPKVLVKMRVGGASNGSLNQLFRKSQEDYRALRANRIGGLRTLARKNLSKVKQLYPLRHWLTGGRSN